MRRSPPSQLLAAGKKTILTHFRSFVSFSSVNRSKNKSTAIGFLRLLALFLTLPTRADVTILGGNAAAGASAATGTGTPAGSAYQSSNSPAPFSFSGTRTQTDGVGAVVASATSSLTATFSGYGSVQATSTVPSPKDGFTGADGNSQTLLDFTANSTQIITASLIDQSSGELILRTFTNSGSPLVFDLKSSGIESAQLVAGTSYQATFSVDYSQYDGASEEGSEPGAFAYSLYLPAETPAAVPEPSHLTLMLMGIAGMAGWITLRKRSALAGSRFQGISFTLRRRCPRILPAARAGC
jgi:hypothetical protein